MKNYQTTLFIPVASFLATLSFGGRTVPIPDREFLQVQARGQKFEIEAGRLAVTRGDDSFTKSFGRMMIDDHKKALDKVQDIARHKGFGRLSTSFDRKQRHDIEKLSRLRGRDFDRTYRDIMLTDHKEDFDLFQRESIDANDPAVRTFATECIPVIQKHLASIQGHKMPR